MREHIKLFESQEQLIHEFMKKYEIENYTITPEGVDVHQNVHLFNRKLTEFPFQFNIVHGFFECSDNKLESLQGAPRVVHGSFYCDNNKIKSLQFCPKFVEGNLDCNSNPIEPWEHRYLLFSEIQGEIKTETDGLDEFFHKYQNKKALIPQALKELREIQIWWDQNA